MEFIFIGLLFAIFSAVIASSKKRSAFAWFIIGLLFGPFGLLVALFPKTNESKNIVKINTSNTNSDTDALDMLKKLAELKEAGIISDDEFKGKKQLLLSKIEGLEQNI